MKVDEIDRDDLIIIEDQTDWKPTKKMILAYANLFEYDPKKDPKEILEISKKYLTCNLPDNKIRAFFKNDYRIVYIDKHTRNITSRSELEIKAKNEIEKCRKNLYISNKNIFKTDRELKLKTEQYNKNNKKYQEYNKSEEVNFYREEESIFVKTNKSLRDTNVSCKNDYTKKLEYFNKEKKKGKKEVAINIRKIPNKRSNKKDINIPNERYSNNDSLNNSEEYNSIKNESYKKNDSEEKKDYLKTSILNLEKYKNKLKKEYINKKTNFIKKNSEKIMSKLRIKKSLEINYEDSNELEDYEKSLKTKMEKELDKYKKKLLLEYEKDFLNEFEDLDLEKELKIQKLKLESAIRILKIKNKTKIDKEILDTGTLIENKKLNLEENYQNKKYKLEKKNKNKIIEHRKKLENEYERYVHDRKSNQFTKNEEDGKNAFPSIEFQESEEENIRELNEKFEQDKIIINNNLDNKLIKDLENYKIQTSNNIKVEKNNIITKTNFLPEQYSKDLNLIKMKIDLQKEKAKTMINKKLNEIGTSFLKGIQNKYLDNLNKEMEEIFWIIKQQGNNYHNKDNEIKMEEILMEKFLFYNPKLNELKSKYDLIEEDFNKIIINVKYTSKAFSIINKFNLENGSKFTLISDFENKDDFFVSQLILILQNELDEFIIKNKDDLINKKIYPLLNEEINNFVENLKKIKEETIRKNNRNNSNYFPQNKNTNNLFDSDYTDLFGFIDFIFPKNDSNKLENGSFYANQKSSNNTKAIFDNNNTNKYKHSNFYCKTYVDDFLKPIESPFSNNNYSENNMELSRQILKDFSEDLLILYEKIISLLKQENAQIEKAQQFLMNYNNNLEEDFFLNEKKKISGNIKSKIKSRINDFKEIMNQWREAIYEICNNYSKPENIKNILIRFITKFKSYKNFYYSQNGDIFENKIYIINNDNNDSKIKNTFKEKNNKNVNRHNSTNIFKYGRTNLTNSLFDP